MEMKPSVISIVHIAHAMKICCNCLMICHITGIILTISNHSRPFLKLPMMQTELRV